MNSSLAKAKKGQRCTEEIFDFSFSLALVILSVCGQDINTVSNFLVWSPNPSAIIGAIWPQERPRIKLTIFNVHHDLLGPNGATTAVFLLCRINETQDMRNSINNACYIKKRDNVSSVVNKFFGQNRISIVWSLLRSMYCTYYFWGHKSKNTRFFIKWKRMILDWVVYVSVSAGNSWVWLSVR